MQRRVEVMQQEGRAPTLEELYSDEAEGEAEYPNPKTSSPKPKEGTEDPTRDLDVQNMSICTTIPPPKEDNEEHDSTPSTEQSVRPKSRTAHTEKPSKDSSDDEIADEDQLEKDTMNVVDCDDGSCLV